MTECEAVMCSLANYLLENCGLAASFAANEEWSPVPDRSCIRLVVLEALIEQFVSIGVDTPERFDVLKCSHVSPGSLSAQRGGDNGLLAILIPVPKVRDHLCKARS